MRKDLEKSGYILNLENNIWINPSYSGINYSDGQEIEMRVASIIKEASDNSVLSVELRQHCTDWPSLYHLSGTRSNILRPFEKILKGDILEIGAGCGAITRYLGECGANVLALEGSPQRAAIARSRTRDLENVTVVSEKFEAFECTRQFDVITLIGVLEYANIFTSSENSHLTMLKQVSSLLKPTGQLIVAIENQLGLKYFAGAPEDHHSKSMYGIEGQYKHDQAETFGRRVLLDMFNQADFHNVETLAPFPDYKVPTSILTEEGACASDFDAGAFAWQSVKKDPQLPSKTNFSLERTWPVISKNHLTMELANSFLFVASKTSGKSIAQGHLAYHYSSDRAPEYSKEITFKRKGAEYIILDSRTLSKSPGLVDARISNFKYNHSEISTYILGNPLSYQFIKIITSPDWTINECLDFFKNYLKILYRILHEDQTNILEFHAASLLPGDYLDAIPSNIIIDTNGNSTYIDREWHAEDGVRLDYLIFRAIMSLLGSISVFSLPAHGEPSTRGSFTCRIFEGLGFIITEEKIADFLRLESNLSVFASGCNNKVFSNWSPEQPLPGLTTIESFENMKAQLLATEDAKEIAERLAIERYNELNLITKQLAATADAKEVAERLAIDRYEEITLLRVELDDIKKSAGYKLSTALRLTPQRNKPNV